jgi:hypothetical protein
MAIFGKNRASSSSSGCVYVLIQGFFVCLLLILNGFIVRSTVNLDWGEELRIPQAIQLVLPVAMIFVELWIYDFVFAGTTKHEN